MSVVVTQKLVDNFVYVKMLRLKWNTKGLCKNFTLQWCKCFLAKSDNSLWIPEANFLIF